MASTKCNGHNHNERFSPSRSIAYEVWFKPVVNARKPNVSPLKGNKNISEDELKFKMQKAIERKKKYEDGILSRLAAREAHARHIQAILTQQKKIAEEKLKQKMLAYKEKKERLEKEKQEKLLAKEEHLKEVQANAQVLAEEYSKVAEEKLQQKLAASQEKAEALRKAKEQKLKEHEKRIKEAQMSVQEQAEIQSKIIEEKIQQKMEVFKENRESSLAALKVRLREKSLDIEQKKQMVDEIQTLQAKIFEEKHLQKMEKYGTNKKALMKARQDHLEAHKKHGELVRSNALERKHHIKQG